MPPSQPIFTSRIRGYVCKSCLLRLQKPLRRQPPWLSKSFASDTGSSKTKFSQANKSKAQGHETPDGDIRYFEETPDGDRREIEAEDAEEEMLRETVEATLRNFDNVLGKKSEQLGVSADELEKDYGMSQEELEEGLDTFGGEMGEEDLDGEYSGQQWSQQWSTDDFEQMAQSEDFDGNMSEDFFMKQMTEGDRVEYDEQERMADQMVAQMEKYKNQEIFTEEDKKALREELLAGLEEEPVESDNEVKDVLPSMPLISPPAAIKTHGIVSDCTPKSGPAVPGSPADFDSVPRVTIDADYFPDLWRKRISTLNRILQRAVRLLEEDKLGENVQKAAWQSYLLCSKGLLQAPKGIPIDVWSLLWEIFEKPNEGNYGRMEHIFRLGSDMRKANVSLQPRQHVLYIEARFMEGNERGAIKEWEGNKQILGRDSLTFKRYWILGIRMFGEKGDASKALDAVTQFLERSSNAEDHRILLPVIKAFLAVDTKSGLRSAWAAYENLKLNLGALMRMEDYDAVAALFLAANKGDQALLVFTDMMFAAENFRKRKEQLMNRDIKEIKTISNLDKIPVNLEDSRAFASLPAHLANKYFFGKWIKKLIGDGDLSGTKKVFDLMRERGIRADAKQMNGLVGALYRSQTRNDHKLGHELAWQMIESRLDFVRQRDRKYDLAASLQTVESDEKLDHKTILLMPIATIETFSILLEQYRRGNRKDEIGRLYMALRDAKVHPNTDFMNQMILSNWRSHDTQWTWNTYKTLVAQQVLPDYDTFNYLWGIMRKATDPMTKESFEFIACRELFHDMVSRAPTLSKTQSLPRELYDAVILAFSLSNDQAGTAVALRAMQRHFNMYPNEDTARTVVLQLTRTGFRVSMREPPEAKPRPGRWGHRPRKLNLSARQTRERVHEVTKLFAALKKQRTDALLQQGLVLDDLGDEAKAEESLLVLSDMLRHVHQARLESNDKDWRQPKNAMAKSQAAAKMMGVQDCDPWANASEIIYVDE